MTQISATVPLSEVVPAPASGRNRWKSINFTIKNRLYINKNLFTSQFWSDSDCSCDIISFQTIIFWKYKVVLKRHVKKYENLANIYINEKRDKFEKGWHVLLKTWSKCSYYFWVFKLCHATFVRTEQSKSVIAVPSTAGSSQIPTIWYKRNIFFSIQYREFQ